VLGSALRNHDLWRLVALLAGGTAGFALAYWLNWGPLFVLLPVAGALVGRAVLPSHLAGTLDARRAQSVQAGLAKLDARLRELDEAVHRIEDLRQRIGSQVAPTHRAVALRALHAAEEATHRQRDRSLVHRFELRVAQWQNRLQPMHRGWRHFDDGECERHLRELDAAIVEGRDLADGWRSSPLSLTRSGEAAAERLGRMLAACGQLRQALLVRQAVALTAAAPGVREAFGNGSLPHDAVDQIEQLRDGVAVSELHEAMHDLAEETGRVRGELQAIAEVEALVDVPTRS
jgi:hypothetical protein